MHIGILTGFSSVEMLICSPPRGLKHVAVSNFSAAPFSMVTTHLESPCSDSLMLNSAPGLNVRAVLVVTLGCCVHVLVLMALLFGVILWVVDGGGGCVRHYFMTILVISVSGSA